MNRYASHQRLLGVARGNHEVIGARRDTGESGLAAGVGVRRYQLRNHMAVRGEASRVRTSSIEAEVSKGASGQSWNGLGSNRETAQQSRRERGRIAANERDSQKSLAYSTVMMP